MLLNFTIACAIMVAAVIGLLQVRRYLRGASGGLTIKERNDEAPTAQEIAALIAAYHREKAQPGDASGAAPAATPLAPTSPSPAQAVQPGPPRPILQGPAKVLFLLLKSALPEHHVFVCARLTDVARQFGLPPTPQGRAQFAQARVDFVVCNKDLVVVAMLDLSDGTRPDDPIKQHLQPRLSAAGVRYMRIAPDALPKPAEVRQLILGKH